MSLFRPEDHRGKQEIVSDSDIVLEADRDQDGAGDLVFRTGGVERARIAANGTGTGWPNVLGGSLPVNVKAYNAVGDGVADDYAAILAAYNALPATGGALYFPPGTYKHLTAFAFSATSSKPVALIGDGAASVLAPGFAAGDAVTITGDGSSEITVNRLTIKPSVTRNQGTYNLAVKNGSGVNVSNVVIQSTGGGQFKFDTCTYLQVSNCRGRGIGSSSDTALRIIACNGDPTFNGGRFETAAGVTGYTGCKPPLYVTGTCTGLKFNGTTFTGAGPRSQWTVSGITSDASKFTVTTSANHDFRVGDFTVLRGMTPSHYNSMWRVATVPSATTFTVTDTTNAGSSSVNGTAESVAACGYVSNEDAGSALSVNEAAFTGCLFEASQTGLYGSAALYFDGRRGTYPTGSQSGSLSGWTLTGNYFDQYHIGCLISGQASNAANEPTVNGFTGSGNISNARGRALHIEQAQGVTLDAFQGYVPGSVTPINDGISSSCGLYIHPGLAAPFTQGIAVTGSHLGMPRNWQSTNNTPFVYGVVLDVPESIQDLTITGCNVFGSSQAFLETNTVSGIASCRWKIDDNIVNSGSLPPGTTNALPSIASASTITLISTYHDVIKITGTTNIGTINRAYFGRKVTFIFTGALSLVTGGNLAIGANRTVLAGDAISMVYDGSAWYVR